MTKWECKILSAKETQIEKHLEFYLEKGFEPVSMALEKGVYGETIVVVMLRRPVID